MAFAGAHCLRQRTTPWASASGVTRGGRKPPIF